MHFKAFINAKIFSEYGQHIFRKLWDVVNAAKHCPLAWLRHKTIPYYRDAFNFVWLDLQIFLETTKKAIQTCSTLPVICLIFVI